MLRHRFATVAGIGIAIGLTVRVAAAQVSPIAPPHPNMPWNYYNPQGQVIRYIQMPPQQVIIDVPAPVAPAPSSSSDETPDGDKAAEAPKPQETQPQVQQQVIEIPGYTITETTAGFIYPERWSLQRTADGGFTWVKLPAQFQRK